MKAAYDNAGVYQKEDGDGTQIVTAMLQALGKTTDDVEVLETIPYYELANAYNQVAEQVKSQGYYTGLAPMQNDWFAGNPLKTGFIRTAESIPVLAGTVIGEFDFGAVVNRKHELTKQEALAFLQEKIRRTHRKSSGIIPEGISGEVRSGSVVCGYRVPYTDDCVASGKSKAFRTGVFVSTDL